MKTRLWMVLSALALAQAACGSCGSQELVGNDGDAGSTFDGGPSDSGQGGVTCRPCLTSNDCGGSAACVQYGANDYCGHLCATPADCAATESCTPSMTFDGTLVYACVPKSGGCGTSLGCGSCAAATTCDTATGFCVPTPQDGGNLGTDGGVCGVYVPPSTPSCCHSCTAGAANCQTNGCYGGWWCDSSLCRCHAPPTSCGGSSDGGTADAGGGGGTDAGTPTGTVGANGGTVSRLYFAVVGDTRPPSLDATSSYPTAIIDRIYRDIEAMNPRPQFAVATGDYVFASANGPEAAPQLQIYAQAAARFTGPLFAVIGNHECTGYTASNCAAQTTNNYSAYLSALVTPLGKSKPYYTIPLNATDGSWTAKLIAVACNAWDATQRFWLASELAKPTTYTFVARHEPSSATNAPCVSDVDGLLATSSYNLLLVGHTHTFSHYQRELVVGNGGAPLSGTANFGYATVEQIPTGFVVTEYDYLSALPISSYTVP